MKLKISEAELARRPLLFRYAYYVLSSFRLLSLTRWRRAGEPNPFVQRTYRHKGTERVEFVEAFCDLLQSRGPGSRNLSG